MRRRETESRWHRKDWWHVPVVVALIAVQPFIAEVGVSRAMSIVGLVLFASATWRKMWRTGKVTTLEQMGEPNDRIENVLMVYGAPLLIGSILVSLSID